MVYMYVRRLLISLVGKVVMEAEGTEILKSYIEVSMV